MGCLVITYKCDRTGDVPQPISTNNIYENRLKEFIIEDIEEELDDNEALEDTQIEKGSNTNIGGLDPDDLFTFNSAAPFFPLPPAVLNVNEFVEEQRDTGAANGVLLHMWQSNLAMSMYLFPCLNLIIHLAQKSCYDKAVLYLQQS